MKITSISLDAVVSALVYVGNFEIWLAWSILARKYIFIPQFDCFLAFKLYVMRIFNATWLRSGIFYASWSDNSQVDGIEPISAATAEFFPIPVKLVGRTAFGDASRSKFDVRFGGLSDFSLPYQDSGRESECRGAEWQRHRQAHMVKQPKDLDCSEGRKWCAASFEIWKANGLYVFFGGMPPKKKAGGSTSVDPRSDSNAHESGSIFSKSQWDWTAREEFDPCQDNYGVEEHDPNTIIEWLRN